MTAVESPKVEDLTEGQQAVLEEFKSTAKSLHRALREGKMSIDRALDQMRDGTMPGLGISTPTVLGQEGNQIDHLTAQLRTMSNLTRYLDIPIDLVHEAYMASLNGRAF